MDYSLYYLQEFRKYIALQTASINTIKNYLSDLRLFFSFIAQNHPQPISPQTLPDLITQSFINQYEAFLSQTNPEATTKRRLSSLKKFIDYCATQNILPSTPNIPVPPPVIAPPSQPPPPTETFIQPIPEIQSKPLAPEPLPAQSPPVSQLVHLLEDFETSIPAPAPEFSPPPTFRYSRHKPNPIIPIIICFLSFVIGVIISYSLCAIIIK